MSPQHTPVRKFFCPRPGGLLLDLARFAARLPNAGGAWVKGDYFPAREWTSVADADWTLLRAPLTFQSVVGVMERPVSGAIFEDHALLRIAGYRCCPYAVWEVHVWDSSQWILVGPEGMALPREPQEELSPFGYWIAPDGDVWPSEGGRLVLPEARRLMADYRRRGQDWEYALEQTYSPQPAARQIAAAVLGWSNRGEACRRALECLVASDPDSGVKTTADTSLLVYRRA